MRQLLRSLLVAAMISRAAEAQTVHRVPGNFTTIQAAINSAQAGDTVRVAPGTYVENINFLGKAITVISEAGPEVTIIDGNRVGTVVAFVTGEGPNSVLEGFTVRNGRGDITFSGGGIKIGNLPTPASPTIRRNRIIDNTACSATGVGIYIDGGNALIQGNLISGNSNQGCTGGSGGTGIRVTGSPQILDNIISNNVNNGLSEGGGISIVGIGSPLIRGNLIIGNKANRGGGIALPLTQATAKIVQNVIVRNSGEFGGAGIYWHVVTAGQVPSIINNTIVDNDGPSAIYADGYDELASVKNNVIIGKSGQPAVFCGNNYNQTYAIFSFNNVHSDQAAAYAGNCADLTGDSGSISSAPLFRDRTGGDYRLLSGSPGIDVGDNADPNLPILDFANIPRILPSGGVVDMGAYEFATATTSTLSPLTLTFADQAAGSVSAASDVTLTNTGTATLFVSNVTLTGEFSQTNTCQAGNGIPAGESCTISVRFSPAAGGPRSGQLTITSNSPTGIVDLSGNGVGSLTLSSINIDFGQQRVGTTSDGTILNVANNGSEDLNISSLTTSGGVFTSSNDCPGTMASGSTCQVTIRFAPTAIGTYFGAVTFATGTNESPKVVMLSGLSVAPTISLAPTSLQFGNQNIGTSAAKSIVISNQGNIALSINSILLTGDYSATHDCGISLAANASCTINVAFSPTALGTRSGNVTVSHDAAGSPHTVALSGTGTSAIVTVTPSSILFGNQPVNTGGLRGVTVRNTGTGPLTITDVSTTGEFAATHSCTTVNIGLACSISVTFTPTSVGPKSGALTVTHSASGSPHTVPLSGVGVDVVLEPQFVLFGDVHVGTSAIRTATLTNNSPDPLSITSITATSIFQVSSHCGTTLAAGASCPIDVTFSPVNPTSSNGTLAVSDSGTGSPRFISLSGRGTVGQISLSASSLVFTADVIGSSTSRQVFVFNNGTGSLTVTSVTTSGDFASTNHCVAPVQPGGGCGILVTFSPTAEGPRSGTLTIHSDATFSPFTASLSGTGLAALPVPVVTSISPTGRAAGASEFTLTVTGSNFSSMSVIRWGGVDRPTTFVNNTSLTAVIPASDAVTLGTTAVSVFNPAPGGGASNIADFTVYRATTLTARDLVYDRVGRQIYASVRSTSPVQPNTLTAIQPMTGVLATSTFIGSDPTKLAISGDSRTIYIALEGGAKIRQFDTVSQAAGSPFALGADQFQYTYYVQDIAIDPGNSQTIAVSRTTLPRTHAGVGIYDNGVKRSVDTPRNTGSNVIEFSTTSSTLYGYNNETSEFGFRTMSVTPSGVTVTNVRQGLITQFGIDIQFESGRIYSTNGRIVDPVSGTLIATIPLPSGSGSFAGVVADPSLERVFYLLANPSSVRILAYELKTFGQVGSMTLPVSGSLFDFSSLIRWGEKGLAFKSETEVISVLIPDSWLPGSDVPKVRGDFNGDGKSDVLWRDPAGNVSMWQMNGHAITSEALIGNVWTGWTIAGSGDFNGDGKMDILWRDSSGTTVLWLMNGGILSSYSVIGIQAPEWTVAGVADFNGDGKADILWRDRDGDVTIWLMDGSNIIKNEFLGNVWHEWIIVDTGDFNGDGRGDILWRHLSGDVAIWLMNGTSILTGTTIANIWNGWTVSGTGDFNADGKSDILWRSLTGDVAIWLMNGTTLMSGTSVGNIWNGWAISGTGDFNGDNKSDILWRSVSGDAAIWLMDGANISSYAGIGNVADRTAQ